MSAPIALKGRSDFVKQVVSGSTDYTKGSGEIVRDEWHYGGQSESAITSFKSNLKNAGYENITVKRGVPTVISATYVDTLNSGGSAAADLNAVNEAEWLLTYVTVQRDIRTSDDFQRNPKINELLDYIDVLKKNNTLGQTDLSGGEADFIVVNEVTIWDFNNNALRDAIVRGAETYYDYYRVIRQTITTNSKTLMKLSHDNAFHRISLADIGVPPRYQEIYNIQAPRRQIRKGREEDVLWLIQPPQFVPVGRRKYQIVKEWWEIQPDKFLYKLAGTNDWPTWTAGDDG
jgi:hypothetical protein